MDHDFWDFEGPAFSRSQELPMEVAFCLPSCFSANTFREPLNRQCPVRGSLFKPRHGGPDKASKSQTGTTPHVFVDCQRSKKLTSPTTGWRLPVGFSFVITTHWRLSLLLEHEVRGSSGLSFRSIGFFLGGNHGPQGCSQKGLATKIQ